jgi:cyclase
MCTVKRRDFLAAGAATFLSAAAECEAFAGARKFPSPPPAAQEVVPGVFFYESDVMKVGSNSGWIIFDDYVLVIDAAYPAGAREIIAAVRATTDKPIRFAFDTHHHGDHAYGNQVFADQGATAIAHTGVLDEMKRYETGYYGGKPGRWEDEAKQRDDVRASKLKPPSVLFPNQLFFDDGKRRVELVHLGVAHTHGDALAWLPKQRVLFAGDTCVNGPYNYVGDGNVGSWVKTLDGARQLAPQVLCPGHGPRGAADILDDQQAYFRTVMELVESRLAKLPPDEARTKLESLRPDIDANARIARYAKKSKDRDPLKEHVEKVYEELTGKKLAATADATRRARDLHARAHGHGIFV